MSAAPLSIAAPKAVLINWWQAGKQARLDCTGFSLTVMPGNSLPFTPVVTPVDLALGQFRIEPPTLIQAAKLKLGRTYGLHLVLRNALGDPVHDLRFEFLAV